MRRHKHFTWPLIVKKVIFGESGDEEGGWFAVDRSCDESTEEDQRGKGSRVMDRKAEQWQFLLQRYKLAQVVLASSVGVYLGF